MPVDWSTCHPLAREALKPLHLLACSRSARATLEAIERGDREAAIAAMAAHIEG